MNKNRETHSHRAAIRRSIYALFLIHSMLQDFQTFENLAKIATFRWHGFERTFELAVTIFICIFALLNIFKLLIVVHFCSAFQLLLEQRLGGNGYGGYSALLVIRVKSLFPESTVIVSALRLDEHSSAVHS